MLRIIFHEFLHSDKIGPVPLHGILIVDAKYNDKNYAYEASRSHALIDDAQEGKTKKGLATINADNYAWMAIVRFSKFQFHMREYEQYR